jgi:hypothetical protein
MRSRRYRIGARQRDAREVQLLANPDSRAPAGVTVTKSLRSCSPYAAIVSRIASANRERASDGKRMSMTPVAGAPANTNSPKSLSSVSSTRCLPMPAPEPPDPLLRATSPLRLARHAPLHARRGRPSHRSSHRRENARRGRGYARLFSGARGSRATVSAAYAIAALMSAGVRCGYASRRSASVAPSDSFRSKSSTVIRVPRITGFPSITSGLMSIRSVVMAVSECMGVYASPVAARDGAQGAAARLDRKARNHTASWTLCSQAPRTPPWTAREGTRSGNWQTASAEVGYAPRGDTVRGLRERRVDGVTEVDDQLGDCSPR